MRLKCQHAGCSNECRYTSGYCAVCDMLLDAGGKRFFDCTEDEVNAARRKIRSKRLSQSVKKWIAQK